MKQIAVLGILLLIFSGCARVTPVAYSYTNGLAWLKEHLSPQDKILCWTDYTSLIRSYVGDNHTLDASAQYALSLALTTDDHTKTIALMQKYNATYLFIAQAELQKAERIAHISGTKINDNSLLIIGVRKGEIPGFMIAYMDENVSIYKLRT